MRILAIGAHPDDIEFGCGGILIKEAAKGSQIKYLVCSLGEAGSSGTPEGRKQETIQAAESTGAEVEFLEMGGDCHIEYAPENSIKIAEVIRTYKPNIVLAPQTDKNQHPDHATVGELARDAARFARYGGLSEIKNLPVHKIDNLYYYFVTQPFAQNPDIIVDVSEVYKQWVKTMEIHKTQTQSKAYVEMISARAASLGSAIGTKYAIGLWTNDPIRLNNISDLTLSSRNY